MIFKEIDFFEELPPKFFDSAPGQIGEIFKRPSLIHLKSESSQAPAYFSTLLHGNETSGLVAIQKHFRDYCLGNKELQRDVLLFFGNPAAAAQGKRHLPNQMDMNRAWDLEISTPYTALVSELRNYLLKVRPLAMIDIHNNTGKNPLYSCIHEVKPHALALCELFSPTVVLFFGPIPAHSVMFSRDFPSITVEAGISLDPAGLEQLDKLFNKLCRADAEKLFESERLKTIAEKLNIFETVGRIEIDPSVEISFGYQYPQNGAQIVFPENFDNLNFAHLPAHSVIGQCRGARPRVVNAEKRDITDQFFGFEQGELTLKKDLVPSMFTCDVDIIKEDCLGYLMEKTSTNRPF